MNPHIEVKDKAINTQLNYNEKNFNESSSSLFHVFISEDKLKVLFTVEWKDPNSSKREFQVVKHDHLYLDGIDKGKAYPIEKPYVGTISADPTVVQKLFSKNLDTYGIRLDKVTTHKLTFFESIDFTFTDPVKLEELYDKINEACIKAK
jgi:hypothetical protein